MEHSTYAVAYTHSAGQEIPHFTEPSPLPLTQHTTFRFSYNSICIFHLHHAGHMPCLWHHHWPANPTNITLTAHIMFPRCVIAFVAASMQREHTPTEPFYYKQMKSLVEEWKTNLMSLAILFHLLCTKHVSDINISIFRIPAPTFHTNRTVVLQPAKRTPPNISRSKISNTQRTENKTTDVVIHQHSRRLLKMDVLMSETYWAHNKWNKIASDIKLVFHSSTIAMMHGPINIRVTT